MKKFRILIAAIVVFLVLTYVAKSMYTQCPGDQYWNGTKCVPKANSFAKVGEPCSFGVHCKPGFCAVDGKLANTYSKRQKLWETTLVGKTGTCVKTRPKDSY